MSEIETPRQSGRTPAATTRERILAVGFRLMTEAGPEMVTTRAVAAAAGVQQPVIFRLFGDKQGLLDAVAEHGLGVYVASQIDREPDPDPLAEFRAGCDQHMAFGLAHPSLFTVIWGAPRPDHSSPAAEAGFAALRGKIGALARAGLLRVGEARAAALAHAACTGAVFALLDTPPEQRDAGLTVATRDAVVAAITLAPHPPAPIAETSTPGSSPAGTSAAVQAAITLRASLGGMAALSTAERQLLGEWLDRITGAAGDGVAVPKAPQVEIEG